MSQAKCSALALLIMESELNEEINYEEIISNHGESFKCIMYLI